MLWSCTPSSTTDLIRYLSGLTISQGRLAGQAFKVLPWWQARFVRAGETKPREYVVDVEDTDKPRFN